MNSRSEKLVIRQPSSTQVSSKMDTNEAKEVPSTTSISDERTLTLSTASALPLLQRAREDCDDATRSGIEIIFSGFAAYPNIRDKMASNLFRSDLLALRLSSPVIGLDNRATLRLCWQYHEASERVFPRCSHVHKPCAYTETCANARTCPYHRRRRCAVPCPCDIPECDASPADDLEVFRCTETRFNPEPHFYCAAHASSVRRGQVDPVPRAMSMIAIPLVAVTCVGCSMDLISAHLYKALGNFTCRCKEEARAVFADPRTARACQECWHAWYHEKRDQAMERQKVLARHPEICQLCLRTQSDEERMARMMLDISCKITWCWACFKPFMFEIIPEDRRLYRYEGGRAAASFWDDY